MCACHFWILFFWEVIADYSSSWFRSINPYTLQPIEMLCYYLCNCLLVLFNSQLCVSDLLPVVFLVVSVIRVTLCWAHMYVLPLGFYSGLGRSIILVSAFVMLLIETVGSGAVMPEQIKQRSHEVKGPREMLRKLGRRNETSKSETISQIIRWNGDWLLCRKDGKKGQVRLNITNLLKGNCL